MSYKILALEGVTARGLEILKQEGWSVDEDKALKPEELRARLAPYHAILIRSGTKVTAEALEGAENLKVIGRPGVGVDNVDLQAATRRGVVVMNSPGGNMVSTAELTLALLLALARNIPQANASIKSKTWDRKSFKGTEVCGKRIGVIGLGRIGREVALRCHAMGMEVLASDPFVSAAAAEAVYARLVSLPELLQGSDFITLHTTITRDTRHLIDADAIAMMKPGVRIINAARGALIDPDALLAGLESGRVAGAALDVHAKEPPEDWRLAQHPKVVATPHVGASTTEAQERVGTDIAIQVRDFLKGGLITNAVNFFSFPGDTYDQVRPAMDLAERLASLLSQACPGTPERLEFGVYGELEELEAKPILSAAVTGLLRPALGNGVTLVNALSLAKERGIEVVEATSSARIAFSNLVALRLKTSEAELSIAGTLFGPNQLRVVEVDGVEIDAIPRGHMLLIKNDDKPGVVGQLGTRLGACSVNISRMSVGTRAGSVRAVMLLGVDNPVPPETLAEIGRTEGVREVRGIQLD